MLLRELAQRARLEGRASRRAQSSHALASRLGGCRNAGSVCLRRGRVTTVAATPSNTTEQTAEQASSNGVSEAQQRMAAAAGALPDNIMELKTLRNELKPIDSPFIADNNMGGGFVGDRDRVRLTVMDFGDDESVQSLCGATSHLLNSHMDEDSCLLLPDWCIRAGAAPSHSLLFLATPKPFKHCALASCTLPSPILVATAIPESRRH